MKEQVPAGFWIRFLALLIDGLILAIPTLILSKLMGFLLISTSGQGLAVAAMGALSYWLIGLAVRFFYYNYFYQLKGASPGKQIFDLKVLDVKTSEFLTTKQVFLREVIGKTLSSVLLSIGYIMAGVRKDKRALHDFIGDSKVVRELLRL